jgi:hypothetical protein
MMPAIHKHVQGPAMLEELRCECLDRSMLRQIERRALYPRNSGERFARVVDAPRRHDYHSTSIRQYSGGFQAKPRMSTRHDSDLAVQIDVFQYLARGRQRVEAAVDACLIAFHEFSLVVSDRQHRQLYCVAA